MRLRVALALLVAATARPATPEGAAFSPRLPVRVGDVSGWQIVTGDFETGIARGAYRLYVNPSRAAMYQLVRYRVEILRPWPAVEDRRGDVERVAFVARPGVREPLLLWVLLPPGGQSSWRTVAADTDEYRAEIGVLMAVLQVHAAARAAPEP